MKTIQSCRQHDREGRAGAESQAGRAGREVRRRYSTIDIESIGQQRLTAENTLLWPLARVTVLAGIYYCVVV